MGREKKRGEGRIVDKDRTFEPLTVSGQHVQQSENRKFKIYLSLGLTLLMLHFICLIL